MELIPIRSERRSPSFDLVAALIELIQEADEEMMDGDILAISSKFVAIAENRVIDLATIEVSERAKRLASDLGLDEALAETVVREADLVFSGVQGVALTIKNGVLAPNAGVDKSNIFPNHVVLYPSRPFDSAEAIKAGVLKRLGRRIGVVLTDSRLMPTRLGTTGVAVGVAGIKPTKDERGRKDLFGNVLKVTQRAIADDISSAAQLLMGEADEGIPLVIVRGSGIKMVDEKIAGKSLAVGYDKCIYIRGLTNSKLIARLETSSKGET